MASCGTAPLRVRAPLVVDEVPAGDAPWPFPTRLKLSGAATALLPWAAASVRLDDGTTFYSGISEETRRRIEAFPPPLADRCAFPRTDDRAFVKCDQYPVPELVVLHAPVREVVTDHEIAKLTCCYWCATSDHACALLESGEVACWGDGFVGQLGDGTQRRVRRASPEVVAGLAAVRDIDSGPGHVCVIDERDEVYCWGSNSAGQVGDGTTTVRSRPTRVLGLPAQRPLSLSLGSRHSCALLVDGSVACWGEPIAVGRERGSRRARVFRGPRPFVEVFAGDSFTCARDDLGGVWCGGYAVPEPD